MKLNFDYFIGQVFDLDQKTMNRMIEDIYVLKAENQRLQKAEEIYAIQTSKLIDYVHRLKDERDKLRLALEKIRDSQEPWELQRTIALEALQE